MRRQDVQIGVEYAATGALAYGREPDRNRPRRVRFTDTRPGPWLRIVSSRLTPNEGALGGDAWRTIDIRIVHEKSTEGRQALAVWPSSFVSARPDNALPGDECVYVDGSIKGGLPGEVWRDGANGTGAWLTTLVVPAEIHRTWEAVKDEHTKRAERMAVLDRQSHVTEINDLLRAVGLGGIIEATRLSSGTRVDFTSRGAGRDGELILKMLQQWASDRRPAGWGESL